MAFISAKAQGENIGRIFPDSRQGSKGSQMSILVELQIHRSQGGIKFPSDKYSFITPLLLMRRLLKMQPLKKEDIFDDTMLDMTELPLQTAIFWT